ncbi:MAG: IclR family transcriptional regulator [Candidatus Puniceispirillaceae bacterium]
MAKQVTKPTSPNLRMLHILETIGNAAKPLTISELSNLLDMPIPSAHRLVKSLVQEGFLEKQGQQLAVAKRGTIMASNLMLKHPGNFIRHQIMESLARQTKETINFVVPTDHGMTYVDRVETDWHFRVTLPIGTYVPFYCTASGKTFLASLRKSQLERLVDNLHFEKHTNQTITDKANLLSAIKTVRKQGYALDNEELYTDMVAIAVPVLTSTGHYCGAIAVHGPKLRFTKEMALHHLPALKQAASDITVTLFDT